MNDTHFSVDLQIIQRLVESLEGFMNLYKCKWVKGLFTHFNCLLSRLPE